MSWQPPLPYTAIICRYDEIATKGRNRISFEDLLCDALRRGLAPIGKLTVEKSHGRIFVKPADKDCLTPADLQTLRDAIPRIAGVSSVSPGFIIPPELDAIEHAVMDHLDAVLDALKTTGLPLTYAMRAHRANKCFPVSSKDLEITYAQKILSTHPELNLDLNAPNLRIELEIRFLQAFVSFERIPGPGGLPMGSSGRVLSLLSGGIDSPVASFQMMRRGCAVDFITFHSEPYTPPEYLTKIGNLARILNRYQRFGRLVAVNLLAAQKEIRDNCRSRYRTILYRRFMLRIAEYCARLFKDEALVTGDNVGQVASQTLSNMAVINAATSMMVLRPLATYDKLDAVELARKIGTFELSSQQVPDSCTVFAPNDPCTSSELRYVEHEEEALDIDGLIRQCLQQTVIINTSSFQSTPLAELYGLSLAEKINHERHSLPWHHRCP